MMTRWRRHRHEWAVVRRQYVPPLPRGSTVIGFITANQLAAFRLGSTWLVEVCTGCGKRRSGEYVGRLT